MAIEYVGAIVSIPASTSVDVRPPAEETWRVEARFNITTGIFAQLTDGTEVFSVHSDGAVAPLLISHGQFLRLGASSTGARSAAYWGVKL